jgi:hypothetical protein
MQVKRVFFLRSQNAQLRLPILLLLLAATSIPQDGLAAWNTYEGTIGEQARGVLGFDPSSSERSGTLRYARSGTDQLTLRLEAVGVGTLRLEESWFDKKSGQAQSTGHFDGHFQDDENHFVGLYHSKDGKRTLPFDFHLIARERALISADQKVKISMPILVDPTWASLNPILESIAQNELEERTHHIEASKVELKRNGLNDPEYLKALFSEKTCSLALQTDQVVSLECMDSEFLGGAHPNTQFQTRNFRLDAQGKPLELSLAEVLELNASNRKQLSGWLIQDLRKQKAAFVLNGDIKQFDKELSDNSLTILWLSQGMGVLFSPYAVGPYVEGDYRVFIPYQKLKPLLRPDAILPPPTSHHHE